jgi:autotransporter-associated beta strand protein
LDFGGGAHSNIVVGNYIDDISGDGISLGEVIDYAATDPNQMTDSNLIQDNFIRRPGQEYEDCIGIWLGYSENSVITHNDVDNTPYSGICLGWGWGTATYSHNNQLLGNYVGKVMQTLSDGGSVYSLSAQTNSWHIANYYKDSGYQGIYWDEGSQWWMAVSNVFDNVAHNYINLNSSSTNTTGGVLNNQNNTATNNFSNTTAVSALSRGINDVITNTVFSTRQFWPPAAQAIILQAGLEPAFAQLKSPEFLVNDTEVNLDHAPATWTYSAARGYGDYHGDVHYATTDGDYLQYTFTAPAISWIGEMNLDMSNVDVYLDGTFQQTVNCFSSTRVTQARLFTVTNLPAGPHTLKLLKNGGTYMMLDAFAVTPTNFWLTVTTNNVTVSAGGTFSNMVKLDVFGGYVGTTALSASGLPSGASAIFSSPSLNGAGFSVMTVTTTTNTPAGNYEFNVVGIAGGVTNIATIGLTVIGSANLRWNSTTSGAWDLTTSNWFNLGTGLPDVFQTGDNVSFDDTAGVMTNITIAGGATVQPGVVNMTANNNNFTITGAGAIGGAASVVKSGNGLFVLGTTNSFTGGVTISGGILRAGTASALGASSGTTIITNGGTLDVNGFNLTAEPIVVSGVGFNTNGAIINSGASQISALRQVTLAGDVTFGGTNRWDIRNTGGTANLSTSPAGRAYKITKVGTNQVSLVAVSVIEPALGDIDIQQGEFAIQTSTSQVGDPNKTITVYSGAILDVWNLTNTPLNKKIMMNDGSTFFNESGISQIVSPVTLMGNGTFNVVGTSLAFSNVISGAGNLIKSGGSSLILAGTNNYTGNTFVNSGVLALAASGSISNSAVITIASGATVDVTSHSGSPFSLNAGQTLAGGGTINGSLTVNSNAVIAPGNTNLGVLTINTSANLKGTAAMKLNKTARTNDVILISGGGTFTYFGGCSLVVTNLSGTLTTTDSFRLFNALVYGTSPANALPKIVPAIPALNLAWNTNTLAIDGTLRIANSPTPPPRFAAMSASGYNFILTATNGPAGYPVKVLTSTNVSLALANWTVIATNAFDVNGNFSMTNSPGAGLQKFYALQVP